MGLRKFKPTTSTLRHTVILDFQEITKDKPQKSLLQALKKSGGRNVYGRITNRFRGGGHKQMYRLVDFKRQQIDQPARVLAIEYDPNRSARIALLEYPNQQRSYILAPLDLKVGDEVMSTQDKDIDLKSGNCLPLSRIPLGTDIHNIEILPGKGGQMVRSAGAGAQIMAKEGEFAHIRLPSSEIRKVRLTCRATIGRLGNVEHESISIGKAGRSRWLGHRPHIRGAAMNAVDHPHGGGEGKAPQGNPHPVSPWGKGTKGLKTRKRRKYSDPWIVKRRTT
jgi:large subunit ribosomal protein L2